eukprot:scaffold2140_cov394-Prasinococcus_capsulatus_cf.AAC.28
MTHLLQRYAAAPADPDTAAGGEALALARQASDGTLHKVELRLQPGRRNRCSTLNWQESATETTPRVAAYHCGTPPPDGVLLTMAPAVLAEAGGEATGGICSSSSSAERRATSLASSAQHERERQQPPSAHLTDAAVTAHFDRQRNKSLAANSTEPAMAPAVEVAVIGQQQLFAELQLAAQ